MRLARCAGRRTAQESSKAVGRERLRQAPAERVTCPNDHQRRRRQEFALKGSARADTNELGDGHILVDASGDEAEVTVIAVQLGHVF